MEVLHGEEDRQLPLSILFFKNSIRLPLSLVLVVQFFSISFQTFASNFNILRN